MSATSLGLAITLFGLGRLVADVPAGRLADRLPLNRMTAAAGVILAVGAFLLAVAQGAIAVYIALFLMGSASATMNTLGMTYFSTSVPPSRRGASMGVFSAALLGGQALGPTVGGMVGELGGWRSSVGVAGLIGLAVAAGGALASQRRPSSATEPTDASPTERPVEPPLAPLSRVQRLVVNAVPFSVFFMLGAIAQTLIPIIGGVDLGLSAGTIGLAMGLGGVCRLIGAVVGGVVSDRVSRQAALVPGLGLAGVGVGLLGLPLSLSSWLAAIVLLSISSYGVAVAATLLADRSPSGEVGRAMGSFRVYGDFGMMVGPVSATAVFELFGRAAAAYAVAILLFFTCAAAWRCLRHGRP